MSNFSLDISKFCAKANAKAETVIRKTVLDVGASIVMKTPVGDATLWKSPPPAGYSGGRARANWQHGFGSIPSGETGAIDKDGGATNDKIRADVMASPAAGVHYLTNNVVYANALENGHSTQAPAGMVGLTVLEFEGIVNRAVGNERS